MTDDPINPRRFDLDAPGANGGVSLIESSPSMTLFLVGQENVIGRQRVRHLARDRHDIKKSALLDLFRWRDEHARAILGIATLGIEQINDDDDAAVREHQ